MAYAKLPDGKYVRVPDDWTPEQVDEAVYRDFPELFPDKQPQPPNIAGQVLDVAGDFVKRIPGAAKDRAAELVSGLYGARNEPAPTDTPLFDLPPEGMAAGDAPMPALDLMVPAPLTEAQKAELTPEQVARFEDARSKAIEDRTKLAYAAGVVPSGNEVLSSAPTRLKNAVATSALGLIRFPFDVSATGKRATFDDWLNQRPGTVNFSEVINDFLASQQEKRLAESESVTPQGSEFLAPNDPRAFAMGGAESMAQALTMMSPAALVKEGAKSLTKKKAAALAGMLAGTTSQVDPQLAQSGLSPEMQLAVRLGKGGIEAGTEAVSIGPLLDRWGDGWLKKAAEFAIKDVFGEYTAEAGDWLLSKLTYDKNTTLGDLQRRLEALTYQLPVAMGGQVAAVKGAQYLGSKVEQAKQRRAAERQREATISDIINQAVIEAQKPPQNAPAPRTPKDQVGPPAVVPRQEEREKAEAARAAAATMQTEQQTRAEIKKQEEITAAEKQRQAEIQAEKEQAFAQAEAEQAKTEEQKQKDYAEAEVQAAKAETELQKYMQSETPPAPTVMQQAFQKAVDAEIKKQFSAPKSAEEPKSEPAPKEETVRLVHYSTKPGLTELDPAFHGTGLSGAESKRKKNEPENWVDRTYLGFEDYQKEKGLGPHQYETEMKLSDLYDFKADPKGLKPEGYPLGTASVTAYEKAIRDAGYKGYWVKGNTGRVAAVFEKTPVKSVAAEPAAKPKAVEPKKPAEKTVFDETTTGVGSYNAMIRNPEYHKREKGIKAEWEEMSPQEYLSKIQESKKVSDEDMAAGVSPRKVKEYAKRMKAGDTFPSVVLDYSGKDFYADGWHRANAAKEAGIKKIPVLVVSKIKKPETVGPKRPKSEAPKTTGITVEETPVEEITIEAPKGAEVPEVKLVPTGKNGDRVRMPKGVKRAAGRWYTPMASASSELATVVPSGARNAEVDAILAEQENDSRFTSLAERSEFYRRPSSAVIDVISRAVSSLEDRGFPVKNALLGVRGLFASVNIRNKGLHTREDQDLGNKSYVSVRRKNVLLVYKNPDDFGLYNDVTSTVAHELMHSVDAGSRQDLSVPENAPYASEISPLFHIERNKDGTLDSSDIIWEMFSVYNENKLGLRDYLGYPMSTLAAMNGTKVKPKDSKRLLFVRKEAFAQLAALYYINDAAGRQALKRVMPKAIEFMEKLNETLAKEYGSIAERDKAVSKVFRVPEPSARGEQNYESETDASGIEFSPEKEDAQREDGGDKEGRGANTQGEPKNGLLGASTPFSIPKDFGVSLNAMPKTPKKEVHAAVKKADAYVPHAKNRLKLFWQRWFTKESTVGASTFEQKLRMDAEKNVGEFDVEEFVADFEKAMAKAFGVRRYNQIPEDKLREINDALQTEKPSDSLPKDAPRELKETLDAMRAYIDRLSGGMLAAIKDMLDIERAKLSDNLRKEFDSYLSTNGKQGKIPSDIKKHWELYQSVYNNLGSYLTRSYQAFYDKGWMKKILKNKEVIDDAKQYILSQNPELTEEQVMGEIKAILQSAEDRGNFFNAITKGRMAGSKDTSITRKRKEIAPEIRALLGEYLDPKLNFVNSTTKMYNYLANHHFLMGVRRRGLNTFLFEEPLDDFSAPISDEKNEAMNPLAGLYTTKEFRQGLKDLIDQNTEEGWLRALIRLNGLVKSGKTVGSLGTTVRNFVSASNFALMNGHFDPRPLAKAMLVARSELFTHDKKWRAYVRELIDRNVIHSSPRAEEVKAALKDLSDSADAVYTKGPLQPLRKAWRFMGKAYQIGDDFWKILGYENELAIGRRMGLSEEAAKERAAYRIRNGYPTYSMVPKIIRTLRKFPLTGVFVSFPYEVTRTYGNQFRFMAEDLQQGNKEAFTRRLLGVATMSGITAAISALSMLKYGIDADDDEAMRELMPEYKRNSTLIYTGYDENGLPTYIDASYLDAYDYLKRVPKAVFNGNNETIEEKILDAGKEFIGPYLGTEILPGAALDVLKNERRNGGPIYHQTDTFPKRSWDIFNYIRQATEPGTLAGIERIMRSFDDKRLDTRDEVSALFGLRLGRFNLPYEIRGRASDFLHQKRDADSVITRTVKSSKELSEGDLRDTVSRAKQAREKVYRNTQKLLASAKRFNISEQQIRLILKSAGVSGRDIRILLGSEKVPPYRLSAQTRKNILIGARAMDLGGKNPTVSKDEIRKRMNIISRLLREQEN